MIHKTLEIIRKGFTSISITYSKIPFYVSTLNMVSDTTPIELPASYENVPTTGHVLVSHHPPGAPPVTPVVIVTLNRPSNNNAFTSQMVQDVEKIFPMFDVDERVKVLVLTGAGKAFCAGADLDIGFSNDQEKLSGHRDGQAFDLSSYHTF